jgi:hypothetical protein
MPGKTHWSHQYFTDVEVDGKLKAECTFCEHRIAKNATRQGEHFDFENLKKSYVCRQRISGNFKIRYFIIFRQLPKLCNLKRKLTFLKIVLGFGKH